MAFRELLNTDMVLAESLLDSNIVTKKVNLGEGLQVKEDGKLHNTNANENQELKEKVEALEERIEELEEYIGYLKQTYIIEFESGETIPPEE